MVVLLPGWFEKNQKIYAFVLMWNAFFLVDFFAYVLHLQLLIVKVRCLFAGLAMRPPMSEATS